MLISMLLTFALILPQQQPNWRENGFFGIHFDLHPNAHDTELGREVDADQIRAFLLKVKPDFVQYDCKGHPGYTGYPTKVGSPSPGIVNDALRVWRNVTRELGIPLSIHYSGVWDTRAIELHPDWGRKKADGTLDKDNTCRTSDYDKTLMIPQLIEVIQEYDIDGMWIDGENWASYPCWCDRCKQKFTETTGIHEIPTKRGDAHWEDWTAFHRNLFVKHVQDVVEAVHKVKPTCLVCSNWLYTIRQPEPIVVDVDYLSGDFTPSFGVREACYEARFLASRNKPWDLMAWSFTHVFAIGKVMKPVPHLCQEVSEVLAQGGAVFIYDNPKRSGRLVEWHTDILAEVGEFCRARKEWCFKSKTVPQVVVLHSETTYYKENEPLYHKYGGVVHPIEGAVDIFLELGYSVDIVNEDTLRKVIGEYPLVVIPERAYLQDETVQVIKKYVQDGGKLILSGAFVARVWGDWLGIEPIGEETLSGWLPTPDGKAFPAGAPYQKVNVKEAMPVVRMLSNQEPAIDETPFPAVCISTIGNGKVLSIHGPFFRFYATHPIPEHRSALEHWLNTLGTGDLIRRIGPYYVELSVREKGNRLLFNLVNRSVEGYLSPERHIVEGVPKVYQVKISVPTVYLDKRGKQIAQCYLAPSKTPISYAEESQRIILSIPEIHIYDIAVIEFEN